MKKTLLLAIFVFATGASAARAANSTLPGEPLVEPPTLISLGFEWPIVGDDNRNAVATIEYRRGGEAAWRRGLDLLRLQGEETFLRGALDYTAPATKVKSQRKADSSRIRVTSPGASSIRS